MGLEGRRLAIRGRRIRGLDLGGRWRMEMGMQMGMDRCGGSRVMVGEVESVDRGGKTVRVYSEQFCWWIDICEQLEANEQFLGSLQ